MKFLGIASLTELTQSLTSIDIGESILFAKIEAYSCMFYFQFGLLHRFVTFSTGKKSGSDKKIYTNLEKQFQESVGPVVSPRNDKLSVSPFGPLTEKTSRQIFMDLITTMNCAFPDHDFS